MKRRLHIHIGRIALPALVCTLSGLCALPAVAAVTDISNAPLASASNLAVKPNLLFILDDSGSMGFDAMPDTVESQQGASERKYWDTSLNCKWRSDTTGLLGNHCDRVDPPFGAAEFNGLYYNPQITYTPAKNADGTLVKNFDNSTTASGPHGTWTSVACDPFSSAITCDNFYGNFHDYYVNGGATSSGSTLIGPSHGNQDWTNQYVKNWYGAAGATTFNVQTSFPEIVYCRGASDATSTCRRNGLSDASDKTQTGNPFRYTSATNTSLQTAGNPPTGHNGYPESPPVSEFWRVGSGTTAQQYGIVVTTSGPHGIPASGSITPGSPYPTFASPFKIIPRTNTGASTTGFDYNSNGGSSVTTTNTCLKNTVAPDTTCIITPDSTLKNQFTYMNGNKGQQLASAGPNSAITTQIGSYDLIVPFVNGTGTGTGCVGTRCTVYVTAPNHGLIAGDQIKVFLTSTAAGNTNIIPSNGATVTVLASPLPTANTFAYTISGATANNSTASGYFQKTGFYNIPKLIAGNPLYYTIQPIEFCSDEYLNNCTAATAATGVYIYPAPVRYCLTEFDANRWDTPTGKDPLNVAFRCQKKYNPATVGTTYAGYVYPRYGMFLRGNITSGTGTSSTIAGTTTNYNGRYQRKDCAGNASASPNGTCTGNEELTNFANWWAFYRHRMPMMKTSASIAFQPVDKAYRVGFLTINAAIPPGSDEFLGVNDFICCGTGTQKDTWYKDLFAQAPNGGTPLPFALSRAGRYFAGKNDGINKNMVPSQAKDPMQYSCQQNFALLTTDGYWSTRNGKNLGDTSTGSTDSIGNTDNAFSCVPDAPHNVCGGTWDGYPSGTSWTTSGNTFSSAGTLSDVARYYYDTDLRSSTLGNANGALGTDVATDNVPNTKEDPATWQHMNTFGLGMSDGYLNWRKDWESANSGDYYKIANGSSGCSWDANCRWPVPGPFNPGALDDLWHAAVNGHGDFFYARDTAAVQDGITAALNNLNTRNASGSAAATSTPNITSTDRMIFLSSYTTVQWNGDIQAMQIDPNNGSIQSGVLWSAKTQVQAQTGPSTDARSIKMFSASGTNRMKDFTYTNLNAGTTSVTGSMGTVTFAAETPWFDGVCLPLNPKQLTQCGSLDLFTQIPIVSAGKNLVDFLRGQSQYEATIFRDRLFALGDTINAAPLYVGKPRLNFVDNVTPTYQAWAATSVIASRTPTLFAGANDGMLHAFNTNTGNEMWAYIPRVVMPNLWQLADAQYAIKHAYYVDGSPTTMDIYDGSTWRTILVGGLNSGGRGYYALDVTNPAVPQALWEFCSDSTMCVISDPDLGFSYGNPIITKNSKGNWVVLLTSGYDNIPGFGGGTTGNGQGYLYVLDVLTGKILQKVGTGVGSTASPSGLAKLNTWIETFVTDNTSSAAYGGDLQGNIWEFDMTTWPIPTPKKIGQAIDGSGRPQAITTRPELGLINETYDVLYVGTGRYLGNSDLTDPATQTPSSTDAWQHSLYAFKISPHDNSDTIYGNLRNVANGLVKQSITIVTPTTRTTSTNSVNWASSNGWYLDFNPSNDSPGERVNVDPQLVLGTLIVATNVPGGGACSVGGDSWFYQFDYKTGKYVVSTPGNLVATKIQGAMSVGMSVFQLQSNAIGIVDMRSDAKPTQPGFNSAPPTATAKRSGWRELTPH